METFLLYASFHVCRQTISRPIVPVDPGLSPGEFNVSVKQAKNKSHGR